MVKALGLQIMHGAVGVIRAARGTARRRLCRRKAPAREALIHSLSLDRACHRRPAWGRAEQAHELISRSFSLSTPEILMKELTRDLCVLKMGVSREIKMRGQFHPE